MLKVLDLFCGMGGFTQGFKNAGYNVVCGIDIWDKAVETYKLNHNHPAFCKDLTHFEPTELTNAGIETPDVIVGGPPCQGFSIAGRRETTDPRNSLFKYFVKYLNHFLPKAFVMENVMGILSMKTEQGQLCAEIIMAELEQHYNVKIFKLNASDYEVPQKRKRVLFIGIRKDLNINIPEMVEKFPKIPVSSILDEEYDSALVLSRQAIEGIMRRKEAMAGKGYGFGAQILELNEPSFTIPARYWKDGYDALVPLEGDNLRRLSITEIKRIQSFPEEYKMCGSKKEQIMQLGNAVAPRFIFHVAIHLKKALSKKNIENLGHLTVVQLKNLCRERQLHGWSKFNKAELVQFLPKLLAGMCSF